MARARRAAPTHGPVLIGFAESLAAIECAWMLIDAGYDVIGFTRSGRPPALAHSRNVEIRQITSPQVDASAAIRDLVALATQLGAPTILPLDDDALWLCERARSHESFRSAIAGPTGAQAELALDKQEQLREASAAGLRVPATAVITTADLASASPLPTSDGPWHVKPARVLSERGGRLTRGSGAIATSTAGLASMIGRVDRPLLVQQRLIGVGEGLFGFHTPAGTVGWSAHRRIRMMNPAGSGSSACRSIDPDPSLLPAATQFLDTVNWRGIFMLEFLRSDDGTAWFMELNGRPWGSMTLARRRGLAYPVWAVCAASDPAFRPDEPVGAPHVTARNVGRELLHIGFVARGRHTAPEWPRLGPTLRSVLSWHREDRCYNYRRGELRVFVADTWRTVADKAHSASDRR